MWNHELWCIYRFPISSSGLRNGGDGAFKGKGVEILQAPIDNSTFRYLNLIKLHKSNCGVRIIIIIISNKKMFRKISQLAA